MGGEGSAVVRKTALGVLLGIMPWNFPYYQVARFAGPNLIIGNPVLLKHAPQCPESAAAMSQIYLDAGFPQGAYTNIYARNEQVAAVIADPSVPGGVPLPVPSRPGRPSPKSPGSTSRRWCSSSVDPIRSSSFRPRTSMPPSRRRQSPASTTPVRRAMPPSGSS